MNEIHVNSAMPFRPCMLFKTYFMAKYRCIICCAASENHGKISGRNNGSITAMSWFCLGDFFPNFFAVNARNRRHHKTNALWDKIPFSTRVNTLVTSVLYPSLNSHSIKLRFMPLLYHMHVSHKWSSTTRRGLKHAYRKQYWSQNTTYTIIAASLDSTYK